MPREKKGVDIDRINMVGWQHPFILFNQKSFNKILFN